MSLSTRSKFAVGSFWLFSVVVLKKKKKNLRVYINRKELNHRHTVQLHPLPLEINGSISTRGSNCVQSISHSNPFLLPTKNEIKAISAFSKSPCPSSPWFPGHSFLEESPVCVLKDALRVPNCAQLLFQPQLFPSLHTHGFVLLQLLWEAKF